MDENPIKLDYNDFSLGQKFSQHMSSLILEVINTKGKPAQSMTEETAATHLTAHASAVACPSQVRDDLSPRDSARPLEAECLTRLLAPRPRLFRNLFL